MSVPDRPINDPKITFDVARGIAGVSVAVGAFSVSVVGILLLAKPNEIIIIIISLIAFLSLLCAARSIDWLMDNVDDKQWIVALKVNEEEVSGFMEKFKKYNQSLFRLSVFNYAYSLFVLLIAGLNATSLWIFLSSLLNYLGQSVGMLSAAVAGSVCLAFFIYTIFQMMTKRNKGVNKAFLILLGALLIALLITLLQYLFG